jgi:hypothetical protein
MDVNAKSLELLIGELFDYNPFGAFELVRAVGGSLANK